MDIPFAHLHTAKRVYWRLKNEKDALNIKVYATRDNVDVKGNYPPDYVTTVRTSGSLYQRA
jgi:hypothetical protein